MTVIGGASMKITDGNIFEAMRLMLPEHRELMRQSEQERTKQEQPILSEDEWTEMGYILGEALQYKSKIRVTLFDPSQNVVWEGVPVIKNGELRLQTDEGICRVPMKKVMKIEII
jgi:hypothetical protein